MLPDVGTWNSWATASRFNGWQPSDFATHEDGTTQAAKVAPFADGNGAAV
jgi:hypothetical protein